MDDKKNMTAPSSAASFSLPSFCRQSSTEPRRRSAAWRSGEAPDRLLAMDEALTKLQQEHPQVVELRKLRYFAGVPLKDAANLLGISPATAKRRWAFARAYLYGELADR